MGLDQHSNTPTSKVNIVVGNINGKLSRGRGERRDLIVDNVILRAEDKPDFLAFQDGVQPKDVRCFVAALNDKWPDSYYEDVPMAGSGSHKHVGRKQKEPYFSYGTNKEVLLYDAQVWERIVEMEDFLYETFSDHESRALIRTRCRLGIFEERSSGNSVVVISYHGEQKDTRTKKALSFERKEDILKSNFQTPGRLTG